MKISVFGVSDFSFGKKSLADERVDKMKELFRSQKATQIQLEFMPQENLKKADAILCLKEKKLDLIILDMELIENKLEGEAAEADKALLVRCQGVLEKEDVLSQAEFTEEEITRLANNNFVTIKPVIFMTKEDIEDLSSLAKRVYREAGMISFLTGNAKESRAWELKKGSSALEAAGCVHSDIARGFIKADVMAYDDLAKVGNVHQAKTQGCLHQEDKDYIVKEGDVIEFKFSV